MTCDANLCFGYIQLFCAQTLLFLKEKKDNIKDIDDKRLPSVNKDTEIIYSILIYMMIID